MSGDFHPNLSAGFAEGNRTDGTRLGPEWRRTYHGTGYSAAHQFFTQYAAALTAAGGDPSTQTINAAITYLQTQSNVDLVVAEH